MPSGARHRVGLVCSAALAIAATTACGSSVTSPSAPAGGGVLLSVVSQPGEEIGRGQTHRFAPENASFAATTSTDRAQVFVDIREQSGIRWHLDLAAAPGTPLAPGSYAVNEPVSPYFRTGPYLAFYGNGLGCAPVGRFTVRRVTYGGPNMLSELDATFEQRCPGSTAGLSGEVRIVDAASNGGSVPDISGAWSGFFETTSFGRFQVSFVQSGSTVTGTWAIPSWNWSGSIEGKIALGAFIGSMSFDGTVPALTGPPCQGRAPIFSFVNDIQPLVFLSGQFIGSCQYMPAGILWRLQTRQ